MNADLQRCVTHCTQLSAYRAAVKNVLIRPHCDGDAIQVVTGTPQQAVRSD